MLNSTRSYLVSFYVDISDVLCSLCLYDFSQMSTAETNLVLFAHYYEMYCRGDFTLPCALHSRLILRFVHSLLPALSPLVGFCCSSTLSFLQFVQAVSLSFSCEHQDGETSRNNLFFLRMSSLLLVSRSCTWGGLDITTGTSQTLDLFPISRTRRGVKSFRKSDRRGA